MGCSIATKLKRFFFLKGLKAQSNNRQSRASAVIPEHFRPNSRLLVLDGSLHSCAAQPSQVGDTYPFISSGGRSTIQEMPTCSSGKFILSNEVFTMQIIVYAHKLLAQQKQLTVVITSLELRSRLVNAQAALLSSYQSHAVDGWITTKNGSRHQFWQRSVDDQKQFASHRPECRRTSALSVDLPLSAIVAIFLMWWANQ